MKTKKKIEKDGKAAEERIKLREEYFELGKTIGRQEVEKEHAMNEKVINKHNSEKIKEQICDTLAEPECKLAKEQIIKKLLDEDVEDVRKSYDNYFLTHILLDGFEGYNNLTLKQLRAEYNSRFVDTI